ncbi:hypothetical protein L6270_01230 [Candidatus Parcubacteria bacterium]|nr:hypothetical protein [Patescibacteria group bacterium]MBU4309765.1 hypothetical protein [Patescibacteria group bacterium]MBU4431771.1 hypothetical protein [Patescibacteria group bacterium]MBU4578104.1 hypothetical protein [Patescibacteria group bacterium]MCG2696641.1 hypothetical protein [Candidatus Parcubacteria bacterium]
MTINSEEHREQTRKLERDILELLKHFEKENKFSIDAINIRHKTADGKRVTVSLNIKCVRNQS